jgi:SAM-dependent methyltransferase
VNKSKYDSSRPGDLTATPQASGSKINWAAWLDQWDAQQTLYLPAWENRFQAMLDVLDVALPADFLALDLASGPGSISRRLLTRFERAQCIAVDLDPVLLEMGESTLGDWGGRLRWVEADLMQTGWVEAFGDARVDAVLTTTALHWLPAERHVGLYRQLFDLVRPGGVVLNGDRMGYPPHMEKLRQVVQTLKDKRLGRSQATSGAHDWPAWWSALAREPEVRELLAERERRFSWRSANHASAGFRLQEAALLEAGFKEVEVVWQDLDNRVIVAIR